MQITSQNELHYGIGENRELKFQPVHFKTKIGTRKKCSVESIFDFLKIKKDPECWSSRTHDLLHDGPMHIVVKQ